MCVALVCDDLVPASIILYVVNIMRVFISTMSGGLLSALDVLSYKGWSSY
jgi:hypothetical protein